MIFFFVYMNQPTTAAHSDNIGVANGNDASPNEYISVLYGSHAQQ